MADVQVAMFDPDPYRVDPETPPPKVSPDVRRRQRIHTNGNRRWPKGLYGATNPTDTTPGERPRVTHGAGTDVAAWWPGCEDHTYGDPRLSPDAARHTGGAR